MNRTYRSKVLDLRRPPVGAHLIRVGLGVAILLMAVISVPVLYGDATDTVDDVSNFFKEYNELVDLGQWDERGDKALYAAQLAQVASLGIFALYFVPAILLLAAKSLRYILGGFNDIMLPSRPSRVPADFEDQDDVVEFIETHEIDKDTYPEKPPLRVRSIFGPNSRFVSPAHRTVAYPNGLSLASRALWAILAVALLIGVYMALNALASENIISELNDNPRLERYERVILGWLEDEDLLQKTMIPFGLFVALQIIVAVVQYISVMSLVPRRQPSTEPREGSEHYRGFGHPSGIFNRLPDLSGPLQWGDFANRGNARWGEGSSPTVRDTGTFSGYIFIEQQPQPTRVNGGIGALLLLVAGCIMILAGVYLLMFELLPDTVPQFATERGIPYLYGPVYIWAMGYVAWRFYTNGARFADQGMRLFTNSWFKSQAILIRCVGNHSRADVKVGKSMADSIESSSVVVRSDFTARFFAGQLLSEAPTLESDRKLLAIKITPESDEWIAFFRKEILKLREEGVRPVGVDIDSREVSDIMRANVQVSGARSGAETQARLLAEHDVAASLPPVQPQPALPAAQPPPQIQPPAEAQPTPMPISPPAEPKTAEEIEQFIDQLDHRLISGDISEATHNRLVARWEKKLAALESGSPGDDSDAESVDETVTVEPDDSKNDSA